MKWKGNELESCCSRPDLVHCNIMFRYPFFKAVHCENCNEITSAMSPIMGFIFTNFFLPFWEGTVYIEVRKKEDEE